MRFQELLTQLKRDCKIIEVGIIVNWGGFESKQQFISTILEKHHIYLANPDPQHIIGPKIYGEKCYEKIKGIKGNPAGNTSPEQLGVEEQELIIEMLRNIFE